MTMIDKAEALATCPFCGGGVSVTTTERVGGIVCDAPSECIGSGLLIVFDLEDMETALAAWSRRALPARGVGPEDVPFLLRFADGEPHGTGTHDMTAPEDRLYLAGYLETVNHRGRRLTDKGRALVAALAPTDAAQAPFRMEDMTLADLMRGPLYETATNSDTTDEPK